MTVISSVYKDDDDVKCHTSRADLPRERPGSYCFTFCGLSHFPNNMVLFFLLLQRCLCLFSVYIVVYFNRFHSPPFYPVCMLRRRLVFANRRITIYLYLNTKITKRVIFLMLRNRIQTWYSWNYTQTYHIMFSISCFKLHLLILTVGGVCTSRQLQ